MIRRTSMLLILVTTLAACAPPSPTATGPVTGVLVSAPTCPVERVPPDPACAPRPVAGATVRVLDGSGRTVAETTSAENGRFTVEAPVGPVVVEPRPVTGLLGVASPVPVEVTEEGVDVGTLVYDTGIRN